MKKVEFIPLKYIKDQRGAVLHFVKSKDNLIDSFGECYFSWINPTYIKGWYRHTHAISCLTSPTTNLKVVLFNEEENDYIVIKICKDHYGLIKIPVGVWYSFKSLDEKPALIVNMLDQLYQPQEVARLPIDDPKFLYDWSKDA